MARIMRTDAEKLSIIESHQSLKPTKRGLFLKQKGINSSLVYKWRKKLTTEEKEVKDLVKSPSEKCVEEMTAQQFIQKLREQRDLLSSFIALGEGILRAQK